MPTSNELHVPIDETHMLCASIATDENNQPGIIIYIKDKDGNVTQDISANHVLDTIHIRHLLYQDEWSEDWTQESIIPI